MDAKSDKKCLAVPSLAARQVFGLAGLRERLICLKESTNSQQSSEISSPTVQVARTIAEKAV